MTHDIQAIKAGDANALARAFDDHRERLGRTIRFRVDSRLLARLDVEDILQESYMNAATRTSHVNAKDDRQLFVWFRLIVMQTLVDLHRRHLGAKMRDAGREVTAQHGCDSRSTSLSMSRMLIGNLTTPTQSLRRAEAQQALDSALAAMNDMDREVLALRHFEELTNQEVAAVLDIEPKAASIRYVRALRRLKTIMESIPGSDSPSTLRRE